MALWRMRTVPSLYGGNVVLVETEPAYLSEIQYETLRIKIKVGWSKIGFGQIELSILFGLILEFL